MKNTHRLPVHVKPDRYKIMLKPDLENFTFEGEETIYLNLEKPSKEIILHSADLEIKSVEWAGPTTPRLRGAGKITYDKRAETATFTFSGNLEK